MDGMSEDLGRVRDPKHLLTFEFGKEERLRQMGRKVEGGSLRLRRECFLIVSS